MTAHPVHSLLKHMYYKRDSQHVQTELSNLQLFLRSSLLVFWSLFLLSSNFSLCVCIKLWYSRVTICWCVCIKRYSRVTICLCVCIKLCYSRVSICLCVCIKLCIKHWYSRVTICLCVCIKLWYFVVTIFICVYIYIYICKTLVF